MKKKVIPIVTSVMMLLTVFSYGSIITVSAVETETGNAEEPVVTESAVDETQPEEEISSEDEELIDIGDWDNRIEYEFADGIPDEYGWSTCYYKYTGSKITPKVKLFSFATNKNGDELVEGEDFYVECLDAAVDPGWHKIAIRGKNKYTGEKLAEFCIKKVYKDGRIASAEDFKMINDYPNKSFYLANDIVLPANTQITEKFTGVLDGRGHTIKNYSYSASAYCQAGLFKNASGATFKNINMTGVNISVSSTSGAYIGALVATASNCTFSNVKTYGKITVTGNGNYVGGQAFTVGGIASQSLYNTKYASCRNDIDISITSRTPYTGVVVGGITSSNYAGSISSCTNTGNITAVGAVNQYSNSFRIAGLVGDSVNTASSCKNSGKIALTLEKNHKSSASAKNGAAGICGGVNSTITSCKNTGTVTVNNSSSAYNIYAVGILGSLTKAKGYMSKCNNKGMITFSGKAAGHYYGVKVAGLAGECSKATQCFNKGTIKATVSSGFGRVGGVGGLVYEINNSYNAAKVYLKGDGYVGGLAGDADITKSKGAYYNYNSGKVTASGKSKKKKFYGSIFGSHSGLSNKYTAKYNYYKKGTSSRAYGHITVTNKYKAKATKVSSLKKSKCKKLSSKYWKYNKKVKRMVLKYNAE